MTPDVSNLPGSDTFSVLKLEWVHALKNDLPISTIYGIIQGDEAKKNKLVKEEVIKNEYKDTW